MVFDPEHVTVYEDEDENPDGPKPVMKIKREPTKLAPENTPQILLKRKLEKGEQFQIIGPGGRGIRIWTWDGVYQNGEDSSSGYVVRDCGTGDEMIIFPSTYIIPLGE